jgi:hypothetical protein
MVENQLLPALKAGNSEIDPSVKMDDFDFQAYIGAKNPERFFSNYKGNHFMLHFDAMIYISCQPDNMRKKLVTGFTADTFADISNEAARLTAVCFHWVEPKVKADMQVHPSPKQFKKLATILADSEKTPFEVYEIVLNAVDEIKDQKVEQFNLEDLAKYIYSAFKRLHLLLDSEDVTDFKDLQNYGKDYKNYPL